MFYEKEKVQKHLCCSFCRLQFSDVVKLIPECGNSICGECYEGLKDELEDLSANYTCQACGGGEHLFPARGLPNNKNLMDLVKTTPSERPLSEQAKKLKEKVERVQEEVQRLESFNPEQCIQEHFDQLEDQVCQTAESAVTHINEIRSDLLNQVKERREECLKSSVARRTAQLAESEQPSSKLQQEIGKLSREASEFARKWNGFFQRADSYSSDQEVATALVRVQAVLDEIEKCVEASKSEVTNEIQFEANSLFLETRDHLGKLAALPIYPIKDRERERDLIIGPSPSKTMTGHLDRVCQVLFLPSGRLASCSWDKTIRVWDIASGKQLFQLTGHTDFVLTMAMLPNGWLASGSWDTTIKVWDLDQKKEVRTLRGHTHAAVSLQVLKNGHLVTYSADNTFRIWNPTLKEGNLLRTIQRHGDNSSLLPLFGVLSTDFLVTSSGLVRELVVHDPTDGKKTKSLSIGQKDAELLLVLSNDQVAVGFQDGSIEIFDLNGGESRSIGQAHGSFVYSLLQLPNGNLVSSGKDGFKMTIKVWNLGDLSLQQSIDSDHCDSIYSIDASNDQTLLATGSWDNSVKIWPIY